MKSWKENFEREHGSLPKSSAMDFVVTNVEFTRRDSNTSWRIRNEDKLNFSSYFLVAAKPTTLVETNSSSSLFPSKLNKKGYNSLFKHGIICSLGHKFLI